jgi:hypothetical protein
MPIAAATITTVAVQPTMLRTPVTANCFMIDTFEQINIIITMTGTATRPLMTALQKSARMGSTGEKLMQTPSRVAMTIVA